MTQTLTGNIQYHRDLVSRFLPEKRDIIVYLPPGYDEEPARRYPVLFMQDGQNLFDPATAFCGNDWKLGETADELISNGSIQPLIIVGIYNAGEKRLGEYTPARDGRGRGGRARSYMRFLVKELKPLIDGVYRTREDVDCTGIGGSSLGGLLSLYGGLTYPEVFGRMVVMSPSVWWANRDILRQVAKYRYIPGQKLWLDMGTREGSHPEIGIRDARDLRNALVESGWSLHENLEYVEDEGAAHEEAAWGWRIRDALRFLYC